MNCSICGKEITKRNSYALDDGTRACKNHDLKDKLPKPKPVYVKAENWKKNKKEILSKTFDMRPKCFHCEKTGVKRQELAYRYLIEMNKFEILHSGEIINPFSEDYLEVTRKIREHFGFLDYEEMAILDLIFVGDIPEWKLNQLINYSYIPVVQMSGGVATLCTECQEEFDVKVKLPKMDMKQMITLGAITKPVFQEAAKKELEDGKRD